MDRRTDPVDGVKFVFSPNIILNGWLGSKHQLTNFHLLEFLFEAPAVTCTVSV